MKPHSIADAWDAAPTDPTGPRFRIEEIYPCVDCGRFAVKHIAGETVDVWADIFREGHDVIAGDPTRRETLKETNLKDARALIAAFDSDSVNTLIALTASDYRKEVANGRFRIIARVEDEGNIEKVKHVGADEVISPSTMGGRMMAKKVVERQHAEIPTSRGLDTEP